MDGWMYNDSKYCSCFQKGNCRLDTEPNFRVWTRPWSLALFIPTILVQIKQSSCENTHNPFKKKPSPILDWTGLSTLIKSRWIPCWRNSMKRLPSQQKRNLKAMIWWDISHLMPLPHKRCHFLRTCNKSPSSTSLSTITCFLSHSLPLTHKSEHTF